jgi:galactokinase
MRVSRAPGRLDVMGGIADYTGSLVCESTLDRAAAVLLQERPHDREVQVFSFNLFDDHVPFTLRISLDRLAAADAASLQREFREPGRRWAALLVWWFFFVHDHRHVDLRDPKHNGLKHALYSTVPLGAGVSSSAAIEVATMMNLVDHFDLRSQLDPMRVSALCQQVENRICGAPCGIMDQVTSCAGEEGSLLRLLCQPHELQPAVVLPDGIRAIGINSNVKHSVGGGQYGITRCAAFMAHAMILSKMRDIGRAASKTLEADPMRGYLANLDQDDYKRFFRPFLPEWMIGQAFLDRFGSTIDTATRVEPQANYPVQHAADHHVLEARRVRDFVAALDEARGAPPKTRQQGKPLDEAGHLMYASHLSYTVDAMLGADECDLLVKLVRDHEAAGLYGAKITGGGSGGTVAVLCDQSPRADEAIGQIMQQYEKQAGRKPEAFAGSSPGAWQVGTGVIRNDQ